MKLDRFALACIVAGLHAIGANAASYLPLSDQALAHRAPVIVRAVVQRSDVRIESANGRERPFTITTLEPIEVLKGSTDGGPISVRLPGGSSGELRWGIRGTPALANAQEVLVFLEPRAGHRREYHLVEFGLGHFDIVKDDSGRRFAIRPAFAPAEDLALGVLRSERAELRRDADSLMAMVRAHARGERTNEPALAAPTGDLSGDRRAKGTSSIQPKWVNIDGTEPGLLVRWYWPSPSPNGVVSTSGTQSLLSDGTDGTADVAAMVAQWHGVPATDVRYSSGSNGAVVVSLDVSNEDGVWSTSLACGAAGVLGIGGLSYGSIIGSFKGDSSYAAITDGSVSMRKRTGSAGCYSATTFKSAVLHELGHTLGLGHADEETSIHSADCPFATCTAVMRSLATGATTPQPDDIAAIQWYYGTVAPLTSGFTFAPASPAIAQTVTFSDASPGTPISWAWSFGDGAKSTAQNPAHAFAGAGTYNVTLTATNANGPFYQAMHSVNVGSTSGACTYSLSPKDLSGIAASGGSPSVVVTTPNGCAVATATYQSWVTVINKVTNGNTTTVQLQIASNVGSPARATAIQIADRLFLITQLGP